jgi:hypothetical protein
MMIEILWDMLPFLLVMGFLIIGFSGAFYILFTPDMTTDGRGNLPSAFANFQSSLLSTFLMILGSFDIDVFKDSTAHRNMAIFMFCLYQVLGMIVLLNLLIAIMGDTFDRVRDREALHFWKGRCVFLWPPHRAPHTDFVSCGTGEKACECLCTCALSKLYNEDRPQQRAVVCDWCYLAIYCSSVVGIERHHC